VCVYARLRVCVYACECVCVCVCVRVSIHTKDMPHAEHIAFQGCNSIVKTCHF